EILNKGAMEISNNNLDFCLEYNNNDELGNLCNAFEKMRSELNTQVLVYVLYKGLSLQPQNLYFFP
ncbi:HAMP domain-containing protein, partial [Clostridioides difficile]